MFSLKKYRGLLLLPLLFLCFWWPLKFIKTNLQRLADSEKNWASAAQKEEMLQEMAGFQQDIKPSNYIDTALKEIEKAFSEKYGTHGIASDSELVVNFFKDKLQNHYGIKPLFIVSTGHDPAKIAAYVAKKYVLPPHKSKDDFSLFISEYVVYKLATREEISLTDEIDDLYNFMQMKAKKTGRGGVSNYMAHHCQQFISSYYSSLTNFNRVLKMLVDKYNFQFIYFIAKPEFDNHKYNGMYAIGILEEDINLDKMLLNVMKRRSNDSFTIERKVIIGRDAKHGFSENENEQIFIDSIPFEFKGLLQAHRRLGKSESFAYFNIQNLSVRKPVELKSRTFLFKSVDLGIQTAWLVFLLLLAKQYLWGMAFSFNLRRKFIFVMAIVLIGPGIVLSFNAEMISRKIFAVKTGLGQKRLRFRLDRLENLIYEAKQRQIINNLKVKDELIKSGVSKSAKHINIPAMQKFMASSIRTFMTFDSSGEHMFFTEKRNSGKPELFELNNSFKFMDRLGVLDKTIPEVAQGLEKALLTEGFFDGVSALANESKIMALEAQNTARLVRPNELDRSQFFLLPDMHSGIAKTGTLAFLGFRVEENVLELMQNLPQKLIELLNETSMDYELNLAVGLRSSSSFRKLFIVGDNRYTEDFVSLFTEASLRGVSGESVSRLDDAVLLKSWRIFNDSPIVIAGRCRIGMDPASQSFLNLLPLFIVAFSLLIMIILAEIAGHLFLPPVSALNEAVDEVAQKSNLAVRVSIANNDEFDEMGRAFNEMTQGLLQKRHLSRFVSGRLVDRVSRDAQDSDAEDLEVTVLASDVRNFTTLSEQLDPEQIVKVLNHYFTEMEQVILNHNGVIEKFVGDAIVAIFYPDSSEAGKAENACRAALAMRRTLEKLNAEKAFEQIDKLENGIGIATGMAIAGNVGLPGKRLEYSVTGRVLQRANQLEAMSKHIEVSKILVDTTTFQFCKSKFKWHTDSDAEFKLLLSELES